MRAKAARIPHMIYHEGSPDPTSNYMRPRKYDDTRTNWGSTKCLKAKPRNRGVVDAESRIDIQNCASGKSGRYRKVSRSLKTGSLVISESLAGPRSILGLRARVLVINGTRPVGFGDAGPNN